jgi:hypothetical protein
VPSGRASRPRRRTVGRGCSGGRRMRWVRRSGSGSGRSRISILPARSAMENSVSNNRNNNANSHNTGFTTTETRDLQQSKHREARPRPHFSNNIQNSCCQSIGGFQKIGTLSLLLFEKTKPIDRKTFSEVSCCLLDSGNISPLVLISLTPLENLIR